VTYRGVEEVILENTARDDRIRLGRWAERRFR
jgi:hypothetical protein